MESSPLARDARLLVLGAGPAQVGLLEAARERGVWLAVVDRDPAAPGFRFADRRCILSTDDEPAIERLVGALGIDGLIAPGTDWPVGVAARIAERAALPHCISSQTAVLATNKLRQRERLREAGVPQPGWWVVGQEDDPLDVEFPVVVKAPDRQGQKGLSLVDDPSDFEPAIDLARATARGGLALVEELVDGPEVTVIGFSAGGRFKTLLVTDRIVAEPPAFGVALAHVWPSLEAGESQLVAAAAAAALGIADGPSYTQIRVGPDGPRVMEVAARLGGGHDAELVEAVTGIDLNGLAIAAALGEPHVVPGLREALVGGAVTQFLVAPPGLLDSVEVSDDLEGVEWVRIYREPGHTFVPLRQGTDRAGAALVIGNSRDEAVSRAESATEGVVFRVAAEPALAGS